MDDLDEALVTILTADEKTIEHLPSDLLKRQAKRIRRLAERGETDGHTEETVQ